MSAAASYTVTPVKAGLVFTPASRSTASMTADTAVDDFTYGKQWSGGGADNLASNPSNWLGGVIPSSGDVVRFDSLNSTKGCAWDINFTTAMEAIQLKTAFSSSVVLIVDVAVGTVTIEGGEFRMKSSELRISKNFIQTGGKFQPQAGTTVIWEGTATQKISMSNSSLGPGLYQNYFPNFRVQSSSSVQALSELVIDETMNISSGRFETLAATVTLTGGTQRGSAASYNWDDSNGTFTSGSGAANFDSKIGGTYQVRQSASNTFNNLMGDGATVLNAVSSIKVGGQLLWGQTGSSVQLNLGNGFSHSVTGSAAIGPASISGSPTLTLGASTITFQGRIVVGTGTFSVQGGQVNVMVSTLEVTAQGTLQTSGSTLGRFVFGSSTQLKLNGGTLLMTGSGIFTSSPSASARFSTELNGTLNIQDTAIFEYMDANGFQMGVGANPVNLKSLDFRNGITGGAAISFKPVAVASVTIDSPTFDTSISTNIHAQLNTSVVTASDINVIKATGVRSGPAFEHDPASIVNWGILGTPTGFVGAPLGSTSINWSWTIVNQPLGFMVMATSGGAVSPALGPSTTYWIETGLSTNTVYARFLDAFTDISSAPTSGTTVYTDAVPAVNLVITDTGISSITISWGLNGNPASTVFLIERSTADITYTQISSGPFSTLAPYVDTGLTPEKPYFYRVKAQNGDGKTTAASNKVSTTTLPVPLPVVISITPNTEDNLGNVDVAVTGAYIQNGASIRLKRSALQVILPESYQFVDSEHMTARFNITGALAAAWDVEIENPDGKISVGSGAGLFTVTNAVSAGDVVIQPYASASALNFTTSGGEAAIIMAAGAMADGRLYVSVDPESTPLSVDPAVIAAANQAIKGFTLVPGSIREILAFSTVGPFTGGFNTSVSLGIGYQDQDRNGIVDSLTLRSSTLRLMTLNETTSVWQSVSGSSLDSNNRRITAPVSHFSVYALFGSPVSADLSEVKIYPSPWTPGSGTKYDAAAITLINLTESGTIRIYSLSARLVKEILYTSAEAGMVTWDGRDEDGENAPSGVYLVHIKSSTGESKTLRLGIER